MLCIHNTETDTRVQNMPRAACVEEYDEHHIRIQLIRINYVVHNLYIIVMNNFPFRILYENFDSVCEYWIHHRLTPPYNAIHCFSRIQLMDEL